MKLFAFSRPLLCLSTLVASLIASELIAGEANPSPPRITIGTTSNGAPRLVFPYPAAERYTILSSSNVAEPLIADTNSGRLLGPTFIVTNGEPARFYQVNVTPMSSNNLFAATVLNRLTYGATPDDIDHIRAIGPAAFIDEQLAGEAIIETVDIDPPLTNAWPPAPPLTNWIRISATGTTTSTNFAIYLSAAGKVYIDNVVLVLGTNVDEGPNLLLNGDFEDPILTNAWKLGSTVVAARTVITNSPTVDGLAASGTNCLLLEQNAGTTAMTGALWQPHSTTNPLGTQRFTLSLSYLPFRNAVTNLLTSRLNGTATTVAVPLPVAPPAPPAPPPAINLVHGKLTNSVATLDDLRAWHVFRAIHGKRQLHEVLSQFFQNHFTTQYDKTKEYFDNNFNVGFFTNDVLRQNVSIDLHWQEHRKLREALLNPDCNFHDLLKISVESQAMIIYLDTILNSKAAPNQNYGREILELHSMGADNGYIQQDIVDLAKVWTGWRVDKKDASVAGNPFAPALSRANITNFINTPGLWVLHFNTNAHDLGTKRLFTNGPVATRFGAQFRGGQSYSLILSNTFAVGTNGFAEGYRVLDHLANLPYTMEFVSVKLCQLFVHEDFEYGFYDYTTNNPTAEVQLVKDCMAAWDTPGGDGRKGNIRSVLRVIFDSDLFRGHAASQQKVKTPLEYAVSAIRALRVVSTDTNGFVTSTGDSSGYGVSGTNNNLHPLSRMGGMNLFNRAEPDGFSEYGRIWLNTANLCERMRFVQHLLMPTTSSTKASDYGASGLANTSDPVRLLRVKMDSGSVNDAGAVVDFFLGLFYPGEGAGNLGRDRQAAIDFLNASEAGVANASPFSSLSGTAYDARVRSMVGFLLSLPRFQEQ